MKTLRQSVDPDDMLAPPRPRLARLRLRAICRRAAPGLPAVPRARQSCSVSEPAAYTSAACRSATKRKEIRSQASRGEVSAAIRCHVARFGICSDELSTQAAFGAAALSHYCRRTERQIGALNAPSVSFETKERSFVSLQR